MWAEVWRRGLPRFFLFFWDHVMKDEEFETVAPSILLLSLFLFFFFF